MKKQTIPIFTILFALAAVGFVVLSQTEAGVMRRVAAEFRFVGEDSTTLGAGALGTLGASVYTKTVDIKPGEKVMYITVSTTGDTHDGAGLLMSCLVDAVACNPGGGGGGGAAPTGWIRMQKIPAGTGATNCNDGGGGDGDCHDNKIYYTWCKAIEPPPKGPKTRTVNIRLASSDGLSLVFIEKSHFFIDLQQGSASGTPTPTCIEGSRLPDPLD